MPVNVLYFLQLSYTPSHTQSIGFYTFLVYKSFNRDEQVGYGFEFSTFPQGFAQDFAQGVYGSDRPVC